MKSRFNRLFFGLIILALVAGGGLYIYKNRSKPAQTNTGGQQQGPQDFDSITKSLEEASIETADFKYTKPKRWATLSKTLLESQGAASGIGLPAVTDLGTVSTGTFSVKVSNSVPANDNELRSATLRELQKLNNFKQISVVSTKVNDKPGVKFTYTIGGSDKARQEMHVVAHNGKTFFLLFASADTIFDQHAADFSTILNSFVFK